MAESLTYPTSLAVGKNKADDKKSADAVAADNQKEFPTAYLVLLKITDDLGIKMDEVETNTLEYYELSKSLKEQNSRLRELQYLADLPNASLKRSQVTKVDSLKRSQTHGTVTVFGFATLVAGTLVGLLLGKRR